VRGAEAAGMQALHFDVRQPAEMIAEIRTRLRLRRGSGKPAQPQ
jgi:hypothetical protein